MKNNKKIITKYGLNTISIVPSLANDQPIKLIILLLSSILIIITTISLTNELNEHFILYFLISIPLIFLIWYLLEKIYKLQRKRWVKKLKEMEKVISNKMKKLIEERQRYNETYFFVESEDVKAQNVRELLFNFYSLTDKIKKMIESDDKNIMILFRKRLKNEILLMLKKKMNTTDIKLSKQINKTVSFNKMVHELEFS